MSLGYSIKLRGSKYELTTGHNVTVGFYTTYEKAAQAAQELHLF